MIDLPGRDLVVDVVDDLEGERVEVELGRRQISSRSSQILLELLDVEEDLASIPLDDRQLAQSRVFDCSLPGLFTDLVALTAVENVGLRDFVVPAHDQVLLDDVLDVLDIGVEVREARLDLFDDGIDDGIDLDNAELLSRRLDGLQYRGADSLLVELRNLPGSLD